MQQTSANYLEIVAEKKQYGNYHQLMMLMGYDTGNYGTSKS